MGILILLLVFWASTLVASTGLGTSTGFVAGDKAIFFVYEKNCPVGGINPDLKIIKGGYECIDFKGNRWLRPFDVDLSLYSPIVIDGDFSLEFEYYTFKAGCPFVRVTLFGEKVLTEAEEKNQFALGAPSFVSLRGSCDRFEAGITNTPKLNADAMLEYRRKVSPEKVHKVSLEVRNGMAKVYLDGKKIASEPFNSTQKIKGIGIYFKRHYEANEPYSDYPALITNVRLALYVGGKLTRAVQTEPETSVPPPSPPPKLAPSPKRTPAECIKSVGVGEASVIGGDRASAKFEALARAKWDAIEKALGVTTSVKTIVQNFQLLDEVIRNEVGGFIQDVKVLNEENFADMVKVKVSGCVYPNEAERAISLLSRDTAFSVMVVTKRRDGMDMDEMNPVTTELINILNEQGFKVYDFAGDPAVNPYDIESIIAQRRFIALRSYMSRVLSGAMIVGKVELVLSTKTGQDIGYGIRAAFNVVTARLNYYLLSRDERGLRVIASGSLSALGRAPNPRDAEYRAMEALAKKLGDDVIGKLERYMASKKKVVTVTVKGVKSTTQNFSIKEKLQRVPWVQSVEDLGLGKFGVTYLENTVYLANAIERIPELKLIRFSPTQVEAEML